MQASPAEDWENPWLARWSTWAILLIYALIVLTVSPFVADDAYIVGRYAQNVAAGHGLVYNAGDQVSALTSPLHGLFESGLALVGLPPVDSYRLLAPVVLAGALLWAAWLAGLRGPSRAMFLTFALTSPFVAVWTVGGLETPILAGLLALFLGTIIGAEKQGRASAAALVFLGLLAGLAFLTRHDSILLLAAPMAAYAWVYRRRPALWAGGALAAAIAFGWLGFAWVYYGDVLPTSAYMKLFFSYDGPGANILYLANFLIVSGLILILPISIARAGGGTLSTPMKIALTLSAALFVAYAARTSAQHMFFSYRYFIPVIPAVAFLLAHSIALLRPIAALTLAANAVALAMILVSGLNFAPLHRLPGGDFTVFEYGDITPRQYGHFMDMMKADAAAINAHWTAQGLDTQPTIWLFTGGTAYFLPDFHIFETLSDYRHDCRPGWDAIFQAAYYVQDLTENGYSERLQQGLASRSDAGALGVIRTTAIPIGGEARYWYGPGPTDYRLSPRLGDPC